MGFAVNDIIRIFSSKVPNKKPFAIYRISQKQALVHASSSGKYSAEPNTWIVDTSGNVRFFSPIDNLDMYHRIHNPSNLLWEA